MFLQNKKLVKLQHTFRPGPGEMKLRRGFQAILAKTLLLFFHDIIPGIFHVYYLQHS